MASLWRLQNRVPIKIIVSQWLSSFGFVVGGRDLFFLWFCTGLFRSPIGLSNICTKNKQNLKNKNENKFHANSES